MLEAAGQIIREAALPNTRPALAQLLADFPRSTVALEAGTDYEPRVTTPKLVLTPA